MLDEIERSILKKMYDGCCNEFSIKEGQFLCKSISSQKNTIKKMITAERSCYHSSMDDPYANDLEKNGYIATFQPGLYILTSKGVWEVESHYYNLSMDPILDALNEKYSCDYVPITEKNKVILFATIAAHAFSSKSSIKPNASNAGVFLELIEKSCDCLYTMGRIKVSYSKIITGSSNKTPHANVAGNIDTLSNSTFGLYDSKGYFVSLYRNGKIDRESLKKLFVVIFDSINVDELAQIVAVCKNISSVFCSQFNDEYDASVENMIDGEIEKSLEELAFGVS